MTKRLALLTVVLTAASLATAVGAGRRFYDDDPIAREPDSQDASRAEAVDTAAGSTREARMVVTWPCFRSLAPALLG